MQMDSAINLIEHENLPLYVTTFIKPLKARIV
jgi:hypothetical protein